jgi:hypothetical protein
MVNTLLIIMRKVVILKLILRSAYRTDEYCNMITGSIVGVAYITELLSLGIQV